MQNSLTGSIFREVYCYLLKSHELSKTEPVQFVYRMYRSLFLTFQANFAPETEAAGTKFNSRSGRPDWAVQAAITPVRANRPPPPEMKPSAQSLGNARGVRDRPGIY